MQSTEIYVTPATGFFENLISPEGAMWLFAGILVISSLGSIVGFLTRKVLILIGLLNLCLGFVIFHDHLPLPPAAHAELRAFTSRMGF